MRKFISVLCGVVLVAAGVLWIPATHLVKPLHAQQYADCFVTGASPLSCNSACTGIVTVAASATTAVINTVCAQISSTFGSRIFLQWTDATTVGTLLGVTCNTSVPTTTPYVSAVSAAGSFTITTNAPSTNPLCVMFTISSQ